MTWGNLLAGLLSSGGGCKNGSEFEIRTEIAGVAAELLGVIGCGP
jgi:hypothetical protein